MNLRDEPPLQGFEQAARRFCHLLETEPTERNAWLVDVLAALAGLYAAALKLPFYGLPDDAVEPPDSFYVADDQYRRITKRVEAVLGEESYYWAFFDPTFTNDPAEKPIAGNLWDDLANIYRDVKPGLNAWDTRRDEYLQTIAFRWRWPLFEVHWGLHAVNAMRALHPLAFLHGVDEAERVSTEN